MSLRRYFALVESGAVSLASTVLLKHVGTEAHAVLVTAGFVRPASALRSWTCDRRARDCEREIVDNVTGEATAFLAVCQGSCEEEDPCLPLPLRAEDLAVEALSLLDLTRTLQRLYRLEGTPITATTLARAEDNPLLLGTDRATDPGGCDVFFVATPRGEAFSLFLESRERATRSTRVLVPTSRRLAPEIATRHGAGARVEVEVLEDAIVVRDGALARVGRLRLVRPMPEAVTMPLAEPLSSPMAAPVPVAPEPARKGIAAEIGATRWEDIRITVLDGHTVRLDCGDVSVRRSYIELGFGGAMRDPIEKWKYVLAVCAGRGRFRWKVFGSHKTAKNGVSLTSKYLCAAFGLEESPFRRFTVADGWVAKFTARSQIADE